MHSPILFFAYNRPQHTQRALRSLAAAEGAALSDLFIFADGAKGEADAAAVADVRRLCHSVSGFASVTVVEREANVGLAANIIDGVSSVIRQRGRVIVLEDDLEVSPFFLRYMNSALDFYDNRGVFSISGYTPDVEIPTGYQFSTYMMHRNCSWGWATWRKSWDRVDWQVTAFDSFIRSSRQRSLFNQCGNDLSPMLLRWRTGEIHSWSIRFCFAGFLLGEPTAYPRKSLVRNIGTDGSGTNMKATNRYNAPLAANVGLSNFLPGVAPDPLIVRQFRSFYDTSALRCVINFFKRLRYVVFGA